ncbi:hypothetical protein BV898_06260, partial [Hypsibius exemplaris]
MQSSIKLRSSAILPVFAAIFLQNFCAGFVELTGANPPEKLYEDSALIPEASSQLQHSSPIIAGPAALPPYETGQSASSQASTASPEEEEPAVESAGGAGGEAEQQADGGKDAREAAQDEAEGDDDATGADGEDEQRGSSSASSSESESSESVEERGESAEGGAEGGVHIYFGGKPGSAIPANVIPEVGPLPEPAHFLQGSHVLLIPPRSGPVRNLDAIVFPYSHPSGNTNPDPQQQQNPTDPQQPNFRNLILPQPAERSHIPSHNNNNNNNNHQEPKTSNQLPVPQEHQTSNPLPVPQEPQTSNPLPVPREPKTSNPLAVPREPQTSNPLSLPREPQTSNPLPAPREPQTSNPLPVPHMGPGSTHPAIPNAPAVLPEVGRSTFTSTVNLGQESSSVEPRASEGTLPVDRVYSSSRPSGGTSTAGQSSSSGITPTSIRAQDLATSWSSLQVVNEPSSSSVLITGPNGQTRLHILASSSATQQTRTEATTKVNEMSSSNSGNSVGGVPRGFFKRSVLESVGTRNGTRKSVHDRFRPRRLHHGGPSEKRQQQRKLVLNK